MPMVEGPLQEVRFTQLIQGADGLYGLDAEGFVWKYFPARKRIKDLPPNSKQNPWLPATWLKLTSKGKDATTPIKEPVNA